MYLEADLGVIAHKPLLEAEFCTLDCLWGGLPLVVTKGDEVGERAEAAGAAICVSPGDEAALAAAMGALLADHDQRAALRTAARRLATEVLCWDRVVEPLHALCLDPRPAPDQDHDVLARTLGRAFAPRCPIDGPARRWSYRMACAVRGRGLTGAAACAIDRLRSRVVSPRAGEAVASGGVVEETSFPGQESVIPIRTRREEFIDA
jgi:hypothetical protein